MQNSKCKIILGISNALVLHFSEEVSKFAHYLRIYFPMKTQLYTQPLIEEIIVIAEIGYAGSMLEDPIEQPEQGW